MKGAAFFIAFMLAVPWLAAQGGRPYAIWEDQSAGFYRYVRLDASTGGKTNVSVIPGIVGFMNGNMTAYDPVSNYYHFAAMTVSSQTAFFTLDATTGAIVHSPVMTHTVVGIEYNPSDSLLYGLRVNTGSYDIVTINPATGADTMVISAGSFGGYVAGTFCLNTQLGYYSFVTLTGSTYVLRTYDLNSLTQAAAVVFPDNVTGLRYSCYNDGVYGLWDDNGTVKLEKIDQLTGVHTTIGIPAGVTPGFVVESQSVDANGNYTFRGFDAGNNFALFTLDLSNASVIASANTNDNAVGFEEKSLCSATTQVFEKTAERLQDIYPVPAREEISILLPAGEVQLEIVSAEGKIMHACNIAQPVFRLRTEDWAPGVYFVRARNSSQTLCGKFILSAK